MGLRAYRRRGERISVRMFTDPKNRIENIPGRNLDVQNDVTSVLAVFEPTRLLESLHGPIPRNGGQRRHLGRNFDFADFNGWRHPVSRARRQATGDGFADILEGLGIRPSLGDAVGNRRALGYQHAGFAGS